MKRHVYLLLGLVLLAVGCNPNQEAVAPDAITTVDQVTALYEHYLENPAPAAVNAEELDELREMFANRSREAVDVGNIDEAYRKASTVHEIYALHVEKGLLSQDFVDVILLLETRTEYSLNARLNALYLAVREAELLNEGDRSGLQFALKARMARGGSDSMDDIAPVIQPDCLDLAEAYACGYATGKCENVSLDAWVSCYGHYHEIGFMEGSALFCG